MITTIWYEGGHEGNEEIELDGGSASERTVKARDPVHRDKIIDAIRENIELANIACRVMNISLYSLLKEGDYI